MQIHTEGPDYDHAAFKPWRVQAFAFKAIRRLYPDYPLWRDFPYEYEHGKLRHRRHQRRRRCCASGSTIRRATPADLDALAAPDEQAWLNEREEALRY